MSDEDYLFSIVDNRPGRRQPIITSRIYIAPFKDQESANDIIKEWLKKYCLQCCILLCCYLIMLISILGVPGLVGYGGYLILLRGLDESSPLIIFGGVMVFICACCVCCCCNIGWFVGFWQSYGLGRKFHEIQKEFKLCYKKIRGVFRDDYYDTKWHCLSKRKRLDYCLSYYSRLYDIEVTDTICKIMNKYIGRGRRHGTDYYHGSYAMAERDRGEVEFTGHY